MEPILPSVYAIDLGYVYSYLVDTGPELVLIDAGLMGNEKKILGGLSSIGRKVSDIKHILVTHHHSDHSGGMRPYVAVGAKVVLHEAAVPFFEQVFSERDSTILPDRLDRSDRSAKIRAVPADGSRVLRDADQAMEVIPFDQHSVDMTVTFLRQDGVLFVSDVYSPGTPPGAGGQALDDLIRSRGLDVRWIAGGHGGFISYADFQAALAQMVEHADLFDQAQRVMQRQDINTRRQTQPLSPLRGGREEDIL